MRFSDRECLEQRDLAHGVHYKSSTATTRTATRTQDLEAIACATAAATCIVKTSIGRVLLQRREGARGLLSITSFRWVRLFWDDKSRRSSALEES